MNSAWETFWLVLTGLVVLWYSTITIYVAVRGAIDIKHMLKRLSTGTPPHE